jgi:DNA polymerase III, gamma/tau subunits
MLKTLEEPPEHVKFILATTDPQKIPVTVLSRCLQFNLKQMTPDMVSTHLGEVLAAEQVAFEPAALRFIARAASGSMRDALSLLDQAIAYGGGQVNEDTVRSMLGAIDQRYCLACCRRWRRVMARHCCTKPNKWRHAVLRSTLPCRRWLRCCIKLPWCKPYLRRCRTTCRNTPLCLRWPISSMPKPSNCITRLPYLGGVIWRSPRMSLPGSV